MRTVEGALVVLLTACGSAELNMQMASGGGAAGGAAGGSAGGQGGGFAGGSAGGAVAGGAGGSGGSGGSGGGSTPVVDPCPTLPIPATCFGGRKVVFREWSTTATGDGAYFADQAPGRLGFNRTQDTVWIVKFRTEADTYAARISAYGDSVGGMTFISDKPCDPTFAIQHKTMVYGNHGGGSLNLVIVRNASDAAALSAQTSMWHWSQQLEANHCYYAVFENWATYPQSLPPPRADFDALPDGCGNASDSSCYYLAFDMDHRLHNDTGQLIHSHVIAGYTQGP